MNESELIAGTANPSTSLSIARDLSALGVGEGDVLVVHTSLSSLGWVVGGAAAVIDALLAVVGTAGTVSMPSHSGDWSSPAGWQNPPVPQEWWDVIEADRPAFDPYATPLREMGAVAENLLTRRETLRSLHPLHSHMANGRHAGEIVQDHPLADSFGDGSPLGRLYGLDAKVLLIGVGHGCNTSLHLAESRATWPGKCRKEYRSKIKVGSEVRRVTWQADDADADDFDSLGRYLDASGNVTLGRVGQSVARFTSMRVIVDLAVPWFEEHRG